MEIYVNGEQVSFSLEKENSLFDIYTALCLWAGEQGVQITGCQVNGKDLSLPLSEEEGKAPLDSIMQLAVTANGKEEELEIIHHYFEIFSAALQAGNEEVVRECLKEYPYIRAGLSAHMPDIFDLSAGKTFASDALLLAGRDKTNALNQTEKDAMSSYAHAALMIVEDSLREVLNPQQEASSASRLLVAAKPALENVPVLLQAGKDREAMQCILSFTELALKAIRLLAERRGGQESSRKFCGELNGILNELRSAFELRDSVLIGDLFEYEIAPRIDKLAQLLAGGGCV